MQEGGKIREAETARVRGIEEAEIAIDSGEKSLFQYVFSGFQFTAGLQISLFPFEKPSTGRQTLGSSTLFPPSRSILTARN